MRKIVPLEICDEQMADLLSVSSATIRRDGKQLYESHFWEHIWKKPMLDFLGKKKVYSLLL